MTALLARRLPFNFGPIEPVSLIWLAFTLSVMASVLPPMFGDVAAPFSNIVAVVGAGGCGWLWLFSRSLFRANKPLERWTLYGVAAIIAVEGGSNLVRAYPPGGAVSEFYRILGNAEGFICIGALVLVFAEVFTGYSDGLQPQEKRFRKIFAGVFGILIALTLLWVLNADANSLGGQWKEPVTIFSALAAIVGTRFCISFRKRNPLSPSRKAGAVSKGVGDAKLAGRIIETLQQDRLYATPELKVADLADLLGEQEYKVSQCITGALGFQNFNQLINAHRIDSAKEALADPSNKGTPILSVAFDCGFNSIGPFNRAFKRQVGMTPREYRVASEKVPADVI